MSLINIKQIKYDNSDDLKELKNFFLNNCGSSIQSFTYFQKRDFSVIQDHLFTNLLFVDNISAGYSHLDKDDDKVWFGICIAESYKGKKLGELLIRHTIQQAHTNNIKPVYLSVYKDNIPAIKLYEKVGFIKYRENDLSFFMKKE